LRIKIGGLFREQDIEYVNEAMPDYTGFVFAESRRQVSPLLAEHLHSRLANTIMLVGVFADAPITDIASLYRKYVKEMKDAIR
jgi:phosphoribosylanthranilate isomerase